MLVVDIVRLVHRFASISSVPLSQCLRPETNLFCVLLLLHFFALTWETGTTSQTSYNPQHRRRITVSVSSFNPCHRPDPWLGDKRISQRHEVQRRKGADGQPADHAVHQRALQVGANV